MGLGLSFAAWLLIGAWMYNCPKKTTTRRDCAWCIGIRYTFLIGILIVIKLLF